MHSKRFDTVEPPRLSYDVFVDLSTSGLDERGLEAALAELVHGCGFGVAARAIGFAVSPTTLADAPLPVVAFRRALSAAAREQRHLLVILGRVLPPNEVVRPLAEAFLEDPLVGSVQPRFADAHTGMILPVGSSGKSRHTALIHPDVLPHLPSLTITAECPAAVLLLRPEIVEGAVLPDEVSTVLGALTGLLVAARRRGFRNGVVGRTVVAIDAAAEPLYPELTGTDFATLIGLYPEMALAAKENDSLPLRRYEPLLDAMRPPPGRPRRLFVDCRSLTPLYNGTSRANLGMLDGLAQAASASSWEIDVAMQMETAAFHNLPARVPGVRIVDGPAGFYAAAYTPNQPWSLGVLAELHHSAGVLVYSMLDTIAWDVIYAGTAELGDVWRAVGRFADGLAFISGFSRDRFVRRFTPPPSTLLRVVHLSLDGGENARAEFRDQPKGDHVLVMGNAYDHKALAPTVEILLRAFPFTRFVILGLEGTDTRRVAYMPSGKVTSEEVHALVATARAIVYPSYYEGFGLPPVEGLAYGRDVLVRRSPLWEEIAAHTLLPGRLIPFDDTLSLTETLHGVLSGEPVAVLPQGGRTNGAPMNWATHAAETLVTIEACLEAFDPERWRARDEVLQLAGHRGG